MNTFRDPAALVATTKKDGNKQLNRKRERERYRLNWLQRWQQKLPEESVRIGIVPSQLPLFNVCQSPVALAIAVAISCRPLRAPAVFLLLFILLQRQQQKLLFLSAHVIICILDLREQSIHWRPQRFGRCSPQIPFNFRGRNRKKKKKKKKLRVKNGKTTAR